MQYLPKSGDGKNWMSSMQLLKNVIVTNQYCSIQLCNLKHHVVHCNFVSYVILEEAYCMQEPIT